eukprot:scaffold332_cov117-Cylindrotheca_fusiformis.AAC.19
MSVEQTTARAGLSVSQSSDDDDDYKATVERVLRMSKMDSFPKRTTKSHQEMDDDSVIWIENPKKQAETVDLTGSDNEEFTPSKKKKKRTNVHTISPYSARKKQKTNAAGKTTRGPHFVNGTDSQGNVRHCRLSNPSRQEAMEDRDMRSGRHAANEDNSARDMDHEREETATSDSNEEGSEDDQSGANLAAVADNAEDVADRQEEDTAVADNAEDVIDRSEEDTAVADDAEDVADRAEEDAAVADNILDEVDRAEEGAPFTDNTKDVVDKEEEDETFDSLANNDEQIAASTGFQGDSDDSSLESAPKDGQDNVSAAFPCEIPSDMHEYSETNSFDVEQDDDTSEFYLEDASVGRSVGLSSVLSFFVTAFGIYCCWVDPSAYPKLCFCFIFFFINASRHHTEVGEEEDDMEFQRPYSKCFRALVRSLHFISCYGMISVADFTLENIREKTHTYYCDP